MYAFGPCRVDVGRHVATRDGQPIALAPKTFELLLILVRSGGRVLSRQELISTLWPDTFVEEANLSFQISTLRKALGGSSTAGAQGADAAPWIETVPKLGYRFTPEVSAIATSPRNISGSFEWVRVGAVVLLIALGVGTLVWRLSSTAAPAARVPAYGAY